MKVRQLVGRFAGHVVEMPFHVAQSCVDAGTAEWPDKPVKVRGLTTDGQPVPPSSPHQTGAYEDRMMRADAGRKFHPLDRDRSGEPGGSLPAVERDVCDELRSEYQRLSGGKEPDKRWGEKRLREEIAKL
jgi:hypothetical protein